MMDFNKAVDSLDNSQFRPSVKAETSNPNDLSNELPMPTNNSRFTDHSIHDDFYQIKPKRDFSFVELEDHT